MATNRPYARRVFWTHVLDWARRNSRVLLVGFAIFVGIAGLQTVVVMRMTSPPVESYLLGVVHVATAAIFVYLITLLFLTNDGTAIHQLRGAWGEDNTRDVLKTAARRGVIWGRVDSVEVDRGDIDHLVVMRSGGILAIDSKWRSTMQVGEPADLAAQARKVKLRAEALLHTVLKAERGRHRGRTSKVQVTPLIVMWGAAQSAVPENAHVDGVQFVRGQDLGRWLRELDGEPLKKDVAKALLKDIATYGKNRAALKRSAAPA